MSLSVNTPINLNKETGSCHPGAHSERRRMTIRVENVTGADDDHLGTWVTAGRKITS